MHAMQSNLFNEDITDIFWPSGKLNIPLPRKLIVKIDVYRPETRVRFYQCGIRCANASPFTTGVIAVSNYRALRVQG